MSDTPRTDALAGSDNLVSADFARELERELANAHGVAQACELRAQKAERQNYDHEMYVAVVEWELARVTAEREYLQRQQERDDAA